MSDPILHSSLKSTNHPHTVEDDTSKKTHEGQACESFQSPRNTYHQVHRALLFAEFLLRFHAGFPVPRSTTQTIFRQ